MKDTLKAQITELVWYGDVAELIKLIEHEYEFNCPSFVYAGPGHQSRHTCDERHPHPIEGEHYDYNTEWRGTSVEEDLGPRIINGRDYGRITKLISNAEHGGDGACGHRFYD